ncbi:MAG: dockerin type I domain-containing protein [Planctomycetota bacterium]
MHARTHAFSAAALLAAVAAGPALGQFGTSDWGTADNGLGGTAVGPYTTFTNTTTDLQATVNGSVGILEFNRLILDYNLATPDIIASGGVTVRVDINPGDAGEDTFPGVNANGRDWAGFVFGDTNDGGQFADPSTASAGSQFFLSGGNPDAIAAVALRNSGSALTRRFDGISLNQRVAGNPDSPSFNEPIFDASTHADYILWQDGADGSPDGDPVNSFPSDIWYTLEVTIEADPGVGLFDASGAHTISASIGLQGGALTPIDFDPTTPGVMEDSLIWGDNQNTVGAVVQPGKNAFLVFAANASDNHQFDNLVIEELDGTVVLSDTFSRVAGDPDGMGGPVIDGDANGDGNVDLLDFDILAGNFGAGPGFGGGIAGGDFNEDGNVDLLDFDILAGNFGFTSPGAVPEPASVALLGLAGTVLLRRRRA